MADHFDEAGTQIVEVDVDTSAYEEGHLPGAVGWNWQTQLQDPLTRDLVSGRDLESLLGQSGISNDTTVILYGDNNNWFAAWALWELLYYGHDESKLRLMNGGRAKWIEEGRELTQDPPAIRSASYLAEEPDERIRAFRS